MHKMTRAELEPVAVRILSATCPEDVFGDVTADTLNDVFIRLSLVTHPDKYSEPDDVARATEAAARLSALKNEAAAKLSAGTYGKRDVPPPPAASVRIIKVGANVITVGDLLMHGDIADLYKCTLDGVPALLKVAQRPSENDLLENETAVLKKLYPPNATDEGKHRYLPRLLLSFALKGPKSTRRANVFAYYDDYYTLEQVRAVHAKGLDFRDAAWMLRRMLEGLSYIHGMGYVHGALLPPHVLVHPEHHGARIIDWCYAVPIGRKVRAISTRFNLSYPPEILEKRPATQATDIYMLAECARMLLGEIPPPPKFLAFLRGCQLPAQRMRPNDAAALYDELSGLLLELSGRPKYRELKMGV